MSTPQAPGTAPIVPIADMDRSVTFYEDLLGFSLRIGSKSSNYVLLERDGLKVALIQSDDEAALTATANNTAAQMWVNDLDALWVELEPKKERFAPGGLKPPIVREYCASELHIKDPDGFLMFFTEIA